MTDRTASALPEPGWYIDPGSGRRRWWNGIAWTSYIDGDQSPRDLASGGIFQPAISSSTNVNPWPIWVVVLLPLVVLLPMLTVDFAAYFRAVLAASELSDRVPVPIPPGIWVTQLVSWAVYPAGVVLSYFDWRTLKQRGIVRPFHWAWAFLSIVYLIGRAVVLRRRVGRGSSPFWIYLAVSLIAGVVQGTAIANAIITVVTERIPTR